MTISFSLNKSVDLGIWTKERPKKTVSLKLNDKIEYKVCAVSDKNTLIDIPLTFNSKDTTALESSLLATKHFAFSLFLPARTHTLQDGLLDLAIPLTRRHIAGLKDLKEISLIQVVVCIVLELLTLIVRLITILPCALYNYLTPHPLLEHLPADASCESVFVACTHKWEIDATSQNDQPRKTSGTTCYTWQIHLYSPLPKPPGNASLTAYPYFKSLNFETTYQGIEDSKFEIYDVSANFYAKGNFYSKESEKFSLTNILGPKLTYC